MLFLFTPHVSKTQAVYLVLFSPYRSGCAVGPGVQVLVEGRIMVHGERQNETAWEDSAQSVVHLRRK